MQFSNANYTCLCSPDFLCVHNLAQLDQESLAAEQVGAEEGVCQPQTVVGGRSEQQQQQLAATNSQQSSDYVLSSQCVQCNNLSTYANLSSSMLKEGNQSGGLAAIEGAYERGELLNGKTVLFGAGQTTAAPSLDESFHYLNEARRVLDNCALCSQQLALSSSAVSAPSAGPLLQCSCSGTDPLEQRLSGGKVGATVLPSGGGQVHSSDSSTSKSYHTANSRNSLSLSSMGDQLLLLDRNPKLSSNSNKLSVLPLQTGPNQHQQQSQMAAQQLLLTHPQMDSSLSSLFVYRHLSDEDSSSFPVCSMDPDSLELSQSGATFAQTNKSGAIKQKLAKQTRPNSSSEGSVALGNSAQKSKGQQTSSRVATWLRPRPKSDYIPLSNVLSAGGSSSAASQQPSSRRQAQQQQQQQQARVGPKSGGNKVVQVDADLSQSSLLAKRRQLQQKQQQQASELNCAQSDNSKQNSKQQKRQNNNNNNNKSNGNVKSIYQCVKSHLLDMTTLSRSSSSSNGASLGGQSAKQQARRKCKSSLELAQTQSSGQSLQRQKLASQSQQTIVKSPNANSTPNLTHLRAASLGKINQVCMRVQF